MSKELSIDYRLSLTKFNVDKEAHIEVDREKCRRCRSKPCLRWCPAGLYKLDERGEVTFNYEGCLECGTCKIICPENAIKWNFPRGGFGVWYRYG
ncbi:hypothetical protein B6U99_03160 [Candidatus Geothermarchaeota archaeon ex4572_27]|nr:MAG: hypothetical protein B6U99_03160 [Candidatus Geothermarchaeota archaeon ex4572_27]